MWKNQEREKQVLIESDWNLNIVRTFDDFKIGLSINRIRLEFK